MAREISLALSLWLVACDSGSSASAAKVADASVAGGDAVPAEVKFAHDRAKERVDELKAALAKGEIPAGSACAATSGYAKSLRALPSPSSEITTLLADIDQVCQHDVPKASARAALAKAKAARTANPDKNPLSECFSADFKLAMDALGKASDADAAALQEEFDAVCPPRR